MKTVHQLAVHGGVIEASRPVYCPECEYACQPVAKRCPRCRHRLAPRSLRRPLVIAAGVIAAAGIMTGAYVRLSAGTLPSIEQVADDLGAVCGTPEHIVLLDRPVIATELWGYDMPSCDTPLRLLQDGDGRVVAAGGGFKINRLAGPRDVNPLYAQFLDRYVEDLDTLLSLKRAVISEERAYQFATITKMVEVERNGFTINIFSTETCDTTKPETESFGFGSIGVVVLSRYWDD